MQKLFKWKDNGAHVRADEGIALDNGAYIAPMVDVGRGVCSGMRRGAVSPCQDYCLTDRQ